MSEEAPGAPADTTADPKADPGSTVVDPPPSWRDQLPEAMRGEPTFAKYDSLEAFAAGHLETKRQLSGDKVPLPKGDDDAAGWDAFYKAAGRPDDAAAYQFPTVADGETSPLAEAFRPKAHELGLNQRQVAGLDQFMKEQADAALEAARVAGEKQIDALKAEYGDRWKEAEGHAAAAAKAFGVSDALADKLCERLGDAEAVKLFINIGKKMGAGSAFRDGDTANPLVESDPVAQRDALTKDRAFRDKLLAGDVDATSKWNAVQAAVAAKKAA